MEHRYSVRCPQIIDVCLQHPAIGMVRGRTINIGLGGMLLAINHPRLTVNALVKLSFYLGARRKRNQYHVQAMVVHNGANGIGLMFDDRDDTLHKALLDFIVDHPSGTETHTGMNPIRPALPAYR